MLPEVGITGLIVILIVALLVFGPKRLPEIGDGHLPFNSDFHVNNLKYMI